MCTCLRKFIVELLQLSFVLVSFPPFGYSIADQSFNIIFCFVELVHLLLHLCNFFERTVDLIFDAVNGKLIHGLDP